MKTNLLRSVPATVVLLVGLAAASTVQALTSPDNENLSMGPKLDKFKLDCPATTASAWARVREHPAGGDLNVLTVTIQHTNDRCVAPTRNAPTTSGNYSSYAKAFCGAAPFYYVFVTKSLNGAESYTWDITCRNNNGNPLIPDSLILQQNQ